MCQTGQGPTDHVCLRIGSSLLCRSNQGLQPSLQEEGETDVLVVMSSNGELIYFFNSSIVLIKRCLLLIFFNDEICNWINRNDNVHACFGSQRT